jgi:hypothetical protein
MRVQNLTSEISRILIFTTFILLFVLFSCEKDPTSSAPDQVADGSWVTYSPYKWTHDGEPYHSVYCNVYSDGAGNELKREAGLFADEKFIEILNLFNFQDMDDLMYPPGYNKVDVYINRYHSRNIAAAYWGSIFITIRSDNTDINRYDYLFRHELTHVFQFLIEGKVNLSSEIWFTEGIAIYAGGGFGYISNVRDLEHWIAQNPNDPNQGNPICIHVWDDFPPGADITGYYCNVFDLTMRYLLDPNGLDKSIADVLKLFYDLRNGVTFPAAFQTNFELDIETFEKEYYDRMRIYLTKIN